MTNPIRKHPIVGSWRHWWNEFTAALYIGGKRWTSLIWQRKVTIYIYNICLLLLESHAQNAKAKVCYKQVAQNHQGIVLKQSKPANEIGFFVTLKCQTSTCYIIINEQSMRDQICDITYCALAAKMWLTKCQWCERSLLYQFAFASYKFTTRWNLFDLIFSIFRFSNYHTH